METAKKLILFDIDGTLIDFHRLRKKRILLLRKNIRSGKFLQEISAFIYFWFTPFDNIDSGKLKGTFYDPALIHASVYGDVRAALISLSRQYRLGIWSQANAKHQRHKLKSAGLLHFFRKEFILIARNKKRVLRLLRQHKPDIKIFLIDNQINMIKGLTDSLLVPFLINRTKEVIHVPGTIGSLSQLGRQIKTYVFHK